MKMIDLVKKAVRLSENNLKEEIHNAKQRLQFHKYKAPYQKEKDIDRLNRLIARQNNDNAIMKDVAKQNFALFRSTSNAINNIDWTVDKIVDETFKVIDKLNEDKAYSILLLINAELTKRRKRKVSFLLNYVWNLLPVDFYEKYFIRTTKFSQFAERNGLILADNMSVSKVKDVEDSLQYCIDVKHYIENTNVSDLKINAKTVLVEFVNSQLQAREVKVFAYENVFEELFKGE